MTGSIITPAGTFSAAPAPGGKLNPYRDPGPWGIVTIGGLQLPGVVVSVDGAERPDEWMVQKGISVSGAVVVWRGTLLAEGIEIVLQLLDAADFDKYYEVRDVLRPKIGRKPPAHTLVNPSINFSGITRITTRNVFVPKHVHADNSWIGKVALLEYRPPRPVVAGTVEPPKATAEDPANLRAEQELQRVLDVAAKL